MALSVTTALVYPWIMFGAEWFVDSVLLTRPDYRSIETQLGRRLQVHHQASAVLDDVCRQLALALTTETARWFEVEDDCSLNSSALVAVEAGRRADVVIPVSERPRYCLEIGALTHGRRILSGDVTLLSVVAALAARRIDGLRLARERYAQQTREREIAQLVTEAELRALRAQLNPHFLFNALTTIGYLIQAAPERAVDTLLRLTTMLRAVLKPEGEFTTLGRELEIVDAYLSIERARFEDRLGVLADVPFECRFIRVPSLLVQPLVENAIKHGIAPAVAGGQVVIAARIVTDDRGPALRISVTDSATVPMLHAERQRKQWTRGVGLTSVERRLACHYGSMGTLRIQSTSAGGTVVELTIPASTAMDGAAERNTS
jgi:LytS/YehU family sensor histidine kinase